MEKCVLLCKVKFQKDEGLGYEHTNMISIGTFPDHETAGEFMTKYMDDQKNLINGLALFFKDPIAQIEGWEVADLFSAENIASDWKDHAHAVRTSHESGPLFR